MTAKELQEKIGADPALEKNFENVKTVDDLIVKAEDLGFELDEDEIEKLTEVAPEDLAMVAGGWQTFARNSWAATAPTERSVWKLLGT